MALTDHKRNTPCEGDQHCKAKCKQSESTKMPLHPVRETVRIAIYRHAITSATVRAKSTSALKSSTSATVPTFPASYQSDPLNSSNFFWPTACFKALEMAIYAPVNPFVAISHLVFSGIVSIL